MGFNTNIGLSLKALKIRIKKNEGYSDIAYKDQLGFYTIGYGHLIRPNEKNYFELKYKKKHFKRLFETDFKKALHQYNKLFFSSLYTNKEKELLVEMLFQLGPKNALKFKKFFYYLNKKQKYMACLEMMDSLWYKQTPGRVLDLIKNYIHK